MLTSDRSGLNTTIDTVEIVLDDLAKPHRYWFEYGYSREIYAVLVAAGAKYQRVSGKGQTYCFDGHVGACVEALKKLGVPYKANFDLEKTIKITIPAPLPQDFYIRGIGKNEVILAFPYKPEKYQIVKNLPTAWRRFNPYDKTWTVNFLGLDTLIEKWNELGYNVSELQKLRQSLNIPTVAPISKVVSETVEAIDYETIYAAEMKQMAKVNQKPFPFQLPALDFLVKNRRCILADDMGVGKTIPTLMACEHIRHMAQAHQKLAPTLVISKQSDKYRWENEAKISLGIKQNDLYVVNLESTPETVEAAYRTGSYIFINYDLLEKFNSVLIGRYWTIVVIDEAIEVKNHLAARSKVVYGVQGRREYRDKIGRVHAAIESVPGIADEAKNVWFLTGTPFANRTVDLYAMLRCCHSPATRTYKHFAIKYCNGKVTPFGIEAKGASNIEELKRITAPILLRRTLEEVRDDMPELIREFIPVEIELGHYNKRWQEIENQLESGELTYKKNYLAIMTKALQEAAIGKTPITIEMAREFLENTPHKMLLYTNYTSVLQELVLKLADYHPVYIDGTVKSEKRLGIVEEFQDPNSQCRIFVGNITAAGMGLNLPLARKEIINDAHWAPYKNSQAERRAYRIVGTNHSVEVDYLMAKNTIDELLGNLLYEKMGTIAKFNGAEDDTVLPKFKEVVAKLLNVAA